MAQEMCMEKITSKNNTIIKDTKKLFTSSKQEPKKNALFWKGQGYALMSLIQFMSPRMCFIPRI